MMTCRQCGPYCHVRTDHVLPRPPLFWQTQGATERFGHWRTAMKGQISAAAGRLSAIPVRPSTSPEVGKAAPAKTAKLAAGLRAR